MDIPRLLTPPHLRGLIVADAPNAAESPIPVAVERSVFARGINGNDVRGDFQSTWFARPTRIVSPVAVSDGRFTDAIGAHQVQQVVDGFSFDAPPDGITYCISFASTISYDLDSAIGMYFPYAEFYFCNPEGSPVSPMRPIPLQRGRHSYQMSIWSNRPFPAGWTKTLPVKFYNFGEPR